MIEVRQTDAFGRWLKSLRDMKGQYAIAKRIARMQSGLMGDVKPVGEGVSEARIDIGPGYRLYFVQQGNALVPFVRWGQEVSSQRHQKGKGDGSLAVNRLSRRRESNNANQNDPI